MNSGNTPSRVGQYVRKHRIPWPVIVDSDRSFENACDVGDISLNNIWQARVITATGQIQRASASDLDRAAAQALEGAKWNVDPKSMTTELQAAWQQVEFGNYAPAATTLKRYAKSRKPAVKAAAALLNDYVNEKITTQIEAAATADTAGESWRTFKVLKTVQQQFKGYELPPNVDADIARLEKDENVIKQQAAYKKFELARKAANSRSATSRQRATRMLQQLIEEFPDTEAADEAQSILTPQ